MKLIYYLLIILTFVSSCKEDSKDNPVFANDYGEGMYIASENGVSFYNGVIVKNKVFQSVNGVSLNNVNKIKFRGTKAYIATNNSLYSANIETFENKGEAGGFMNLFDFDFVYMQRIFAVDKSDSKVLVVDMDKMEITSDIETGDITNPSFIISNWYRSIVLNSGEIADTLKDSTIIAINNKDVAIPLADFMGSIDVGDNPNSAVWIADLKVLCKGIYDENNLISNTESSLVKVNGFDMRVAWSQNLNDIYNAKNLVSDATNSKYFFTAIDGVYQMNNDGSGITKRINFTSDFITLKVEGYFQADTLNYANMLYVNDAANNPNTIYKYNIITNQFCDTIVADSPVNDVSFY
tara:strand:+ start:329 stop:1381 length:1053 start_codon:yes stop_codon:yes gene_type:complete